MWNENKVKINRFFFYSTLRFMEWTVDFLFHLLNILIISIFLEIWHFFFLRVAIASLFIFSSIWMDFFTDSYFNFLMLESNWILFFYLKILHKSFCYPQSFKPKQIPPCKSRAFFYNQFYINLLMCDNSDNKVCEVRFQGERTHLFIFSFIFFRVDWTHN